MCADVPAKIDSNYRKTLTGVTDDSNAEIKRLLVDASSGRLKVSATISGGAFTGSGTIEYLAKWSGGSVLTTSSILDSGGSLSFGSVKLNPLELKSLQTFGFPNSSGTFALLSDITTQSFVVGSSGNQFNISSSGTTHTFNLPTASSSGTGQLTAADWTTFNNKIGGTGQANYHFLWDSASSGGTSQIWESGGSIGIGTTEPNKKLHIVDTSDTALTYPIKIQNSGTTLGNTAVGLIFSVGATELNRGKGAVAYEVTDSFNRGKMYFLQDSVADTNETALSDAVMTILNNGNVGIGTTTPNVFKLQVAGNIGPDATTNNLGSVGTPWASVFAGSLSTTSGGTLQGTFLAGTGFILSGSGNQFSITNGTETCPFALSSVTGDLTITPSGQDLILGNSSLSLTPGKFIGVSGGASGRIVFNSTELDVLSGNLDLNDNHILNVKSISTGTLASGTAEFSGPVMFETTAYYDAEYSNGSVSSGATITWDNGNKQFIEMNQNATLAFGTPLGPCNVILRTDQGNRTGGVATWPSNVKWSGGSTLSTGSNQIDVVAFYFNGSNYFGQIATNFVT